MPPLTPDMPGILDAITTADDAEALESLRDAALGRKHREVAAACEVRLKILRHLTWIASASSIAALEQMRRNARQQGSAELERACTQRINVLGMAAWHLDPGQPRHREVMHWFVGSMEHGQELKRRLTGQAAAPARTLAMLRRHDAIGTMARIALAPQAGSNFALMTAHGLGEWTIESGCVRFEDLFGAYPEAVVRSRARLES